MYRSQGSSAYAQVGAKLVDRGHSAIPIMPISKCPGIMLHGEWVAMHDWRQRYSDRLPTHYELQVWTSYSQAGVGLVCGPAGGHVVGVDIDTDDAEIISAILRVIPLSTVGKRGQKGHTLFYRGPTITASLSWNVNNERVCDLIGPGRQTVLPPTVHPDTGEPYVWLTDETLEDVRPDELPELTPAHIEAIGEALKPFGWEAEPERPSLPEGCESDADSPWGRLNDEALTRLDAWIPAAASAGKGVVITVRAGATVSAVRIADVRLEFNKRYPTDEEDKEKRADALRKAFKRALLKSIGNKFATEAIDGVEYVWPLPGAGMFVSVRKPKTGEDGADKPDGHPDNEDERPDEPEDGGEGQA